MGRNSLGSATAALIPEASEKFRFLVAEHGFRQKDDIVRWGTSVTFHGDLWSLYLFYGNRFYGNREFDFTAEIKYARASACSCVFVLILAGGWAEAWLRKKK